MSIAAFIIGAILITGSILLFSLLVFPARRLAKTKLVLSTIFYKNLKIEGIIMGAKLNVKEFIQASLGIVNHADGSAIEATFANETFVSADETIATATTDPGDGPETAVLDIDGIALGETDITVTAEATYIDPNTKVSVTKTKSAIVHVTVTAPVEEAETDLVVTLGTPQPIPAPAA